LHNRVRPQKKVIYRHFTSLRIHQFILFEESISGTNLSCGKKVFVKEIASNVFYSHYDTVSQIAVKKN